MATAGGPVRVRFRVGLDLLRVGSNGIFVCVLQVWVCACEGGGLGSKIWDLHFSYYFKAPEEGGARPLGPRVPPT